MQNLAVINYTFMFTIIVYLGLGYYLGALVKGIPIETMLLLKIIMGAVFLSVLVYAPVLFRRMMISTPTLDDAALRQKWLTANIIRLALYESGALYGLLLRLLGAPFYDQLIFSLPPLFLMIITAPNEEKFEEMKRNLEMNDQEQK